MAGLRLQLAVDVVNAPVPSFPFAARRDFDEAAGFEYQQADGSGAVALPIAQIASPAVVAITADQETAVDLGVITLEAGGFILIYGGAPATNPPTIDNNSGSTTTIRGLVLGA